MLFLIFYPFFGKPAYTMTLAMRLVRASNATILLAFAERLPKGAGFRLTIRPFNETLSNDMATGATQLNSALPQPYHRWIDDRNQRFVELASASCHHLKQLKRVQQPCADE